LRLFFLCGGNGLPYTEDWTNDAENYRIIHILKYRTAVLNSVFDQINAA